MQKSITPKVSVVMATYNRCGELEATIDNIFEQVYSEIELLVVNDGSSDATLPILKHLQTKYDFIIINNEQNLGLQKSLNRGINKSTGKYIARIDDHDRWVDINKLEKQVKHLESNPNVGVVGTGYSTGGKDMINPLTDQDIRNQILMRSPFCHVSVLMSKSIVDKVGGYNEDLVYSEDWDLWLKIGRIAQLSNLSDISVEIREGTISLSKDFYKKQLPINQQMVKKYYDTYPRSTRAVLYHQFIKIFFTVFPQNGKIHKMMKLVFLKFFALIPKKKNSQ